MMENLSILARWHHSKWLRSKSAARKPIPVICERTKTSLTLDRESTIQAKTVTFRNGGISLHQALVHPCHHWNIRQPKPTATSSTAAKKHNTLCSAAASLILHGNIPLPPLSRTKRRIRLSKDGNQEPRRFFDSSNRFLISTWNIRQSVRSLTPLFKYPGISFGFKLIIW